jgi:tetratricopeptide (TPR) repeat protein
VHALVRFPFQVEPDPYSPPELQDPWKRARSLQLPALPGELRAMGHAALAARLGGWQSEAQAYQTGRLRATEALVAARKASPIPDPGILERALAMAPDLPFALAARAAGQAEGGDLEAAEQTFRRILAFPASPAYYDALLGLSKIAWLEGDSEAALRYAGEARAWNPYLAGAFLLLAEIEAARGDAEACRRALEDGLRWNPHNREIEERLAAPAS